MSVMFLFVMCISLEHTRTLKSYGASLISLAKGVLSSLVLRRRLISMAIILREQ